MKRAVIKTSLFLSCIFLMIAICSFSADAALVYQETYVSLTGENKVLVLVNSAIYQPIYESGLKQYVADLEAEGYKVIIASCQSGTAEDIKGYFKSLAGLKGVVFIGSFSAPQFEFQNDFGIYGYASFPIDLFYMDLNGEWLDTDNNGIYDVYNPSPGSTGDLKPEIWVSRLTAGPVKVTNMDEVALLKNYFIKNHSYRLGKTSILHRALAYPDDDWYYFNDIALKQAYQDVTTINDKDATNGTDFKLRLKENYEWIGVCVHSAPSCHVFKIPSGSGGGVSYAEIPAIDPSALFYNLFACSNCRYTYSNYMGGHYIFAKTNGLAAVGSTKTGSMLNFEYFYIPLGRDTRKSLGEAYKSWFSSTDLISISSKNWFYGMTLLGDGTLSLDPPIARIESIVPGSPANPATKFIGSGKINTGSITGYSWRSDISGFLGDQPSFSTSSLVTGEHTIYFKVKDNKNRWSSEDKSSLSVNGYSLSGYIINAGNKGIAGVSVSIGESGSVNTDVSGYYLKSISTNGTFIITPKNKYYSFIPASKSVNINNAGVENVNFSGVVIPLVVPASPAASAVSPGEVQLRWFDNSDAEDGFKIERSVDNTAFTQIAAVGVNVSNYKDTGLSGNRKYYYRVKAYNGITESGYSNVVEVTTLGDSTPPTGEVKINNGANWTKTLSVTLNLSAQDAGSGMGVGAQMIFSNDNATWSAPEVFAATKIWNLAIGEGAKTVYVKLKDAAGNWSAAFSDTIIFDSIPPLMGNCLIDNGSPYTKNDSVRLTFNLYDSGSGVADGIFFQLDSGEWVRTSLFDGGVVPFIYKTDGVKTFGFKAIDNAGNLSGVVTKTIIRDTSAPSGTIRINNDAAYTNTLAVTLNLSAQDAGSGMGVGAQMSFSNDGTTWSAFEGYTATKTWTLASGEGTKTVYAKFKDVAGSWSTAASDTIILQTMVLPAAPSGLACAAYPYSKFYARWTDNANNETGFKIETSVNGHQFIQVAASGPNTNASYAIAYISGIPGKKYYVRVRAYNEAGNSPYSNVATVTLPKIPVAPARLVAKLISPAQVVVSWKDTNNNEIGTSIEKSSDGINFSSIKVVAKNVITYTDTFDFVPGKKYYYRVKAYNYAGFSGSSNLAQAMASGQVGSSPGIAGLTMR